MAKTILFFGLIANALAHAFLFIILPPLGRTLGLADVQTGLILSLAALLQMLAAPLWGHLCETRGRRPLLRLGLSAALLFPAAFALLIRARQGGDISPLMLFVGFLILRACQAVLGGGMMPAAQAFIADTFPPEQRAGGMGLMGAAFGLGTILGGALAWRLGGSHSVTAFFVVSAVAGLAFILLWLRVPETRAPVVSAGPQKAGPLPLCRL